MHRSSELFGEVLRSDFVRTAHVPTYECGGRGTASRKRFVDLAAVPWSGQYHHRSPFGDGGLLYALSSEHRRQCTYRKPPGCRNHGERAHCPAPQLVRVQSILEPF